MNKNLEGKWKFKIDNKRVGIREEWYSKKFEKNIQLPGTMEENGYGEVSDPTKMDLSHTLVYYGWAWYQTEFILSDYESNQCISLFMEKIPRDSYVWVDNKYYGNHNNLCTPHEYDLTGLSSGTHRLVVMVDNSNLAIKKSFEDLEEKTDYLGRRITLHLHTDFNTKEKIPGGGHGTRCFNGILGDIKLVIKPQVHISYASLTPLLNEDSAEIKIQLKNIKKAKGKSEICIFCNGDSLQKQILLNGEAEQTINLKFNFSTPIETWDEFHPICYLFNIQCSYKGISDYKIIKCGLRELKTDQHHIFINGHRLFLRATLEGAAYPLTGYEPLNIEYWIHAFTILKSYGLNGMRMHTFIPPRAAFEAAEQLGFYLQIELPGTSCPAEKEPEILSEFLWSELKRCIELYGNYACFVFMAMGNEQFVMADEKSDFMISHQNHVMEKVSYAQKTDPRHLYSCTAHPYTNNRNDDFFVVATKGDNVLNGIQWGGPDPIYTSRFNLQPPSTMVNYEEGIMQIEKPAITHEVGQWAIYPNLNEIPKYTGVLKPKNYEIFAAELKQNGILHQNQDFVYNSGKLSSLLYKEEIESALRTADLSGFELLDIHDYPGQGTSLVGILDCFFDSKGLITPEEFRNFCSPVVPLCSFDKYVYSSGEKIAIYPSVANYSFNSIDDRMEISIVDEDNNILYQSVFRGCAACGQLNSLDKHEFEVSSTKAQKLTITFTIANNRYRNFWNIWVYPDQLKQINDNNVEIVTSLDNKAKELLEKGNNVLLVYPFGKHPKNAVRSSFTTQFWNPFMKPQEALNGIMCDPNHSIFKEFPTESYTNYQWWEIIMNSYSFFLDKLPIDFFPIVQIVPGIKENKKIGIIWECNTLSGKLLICTADLNKENANPATKQLLYSILKYMNSKDFSPNNYIDFDILRQTLL